MSKKKKYFILLLITLVLAAITAGIYLFVNPNIDNSTSYTVDKYSDVTNWCDTNVKDNTLSIDCKALLINIDTNNCFEVQVITKDKELKDLTICEKGDTLTYTNEVLGYKKLMPIDMVFTYTKEGILGDYSFNNVSFDKVDDTYIQGIVNEDIANLVTIDPSTTTIQNSVDFCPDPNNLPSYTTTENLQKFKEFSNTNISSGEQYLLGYYFNMDDSIIRMLFACKSLRNIGETTLCNNFTPLELDFPIANIDHIHNTPTWDKEFSENDNTLLKQISLIYDSLFMKIGNNVVSLKSINNVIENINSSKEINQDVFCSMALIYKELAEYNDSFTNDLTYIEKSVYSNIKQASSFNCLQLMQKYDDISKEGLFIKTKTNAENLSIYTKCNNLNTLTEND